MVEEKLNHTEENRFQKELKWIDIGLLSPKRESDEDYVYRLMGMNPEGFKQYKKANGWIMFFGIIALIILLFFGI